MKSRTLLVIVILALVVLGVGVAHHHRGGWAGGLASAIHGHR